jgi:large subunit ribosomal protein L24
MKKSVKINKKLHIKLRDKVKIISGQNKGKVGVIKNVIKETSQVIVEGINIKSKHLKRTRPNETGLIKKLEFPIHSSNVSKYEE